jgi:aminopeptidase N
VTGNNLTRAEAAERARLLSVEAYEVEWDLTTSETEFGSTTTVRFGCSEPGASTFVELIAASIASIELNGTALDPATVRDGNRIRLDDLAAANELRVVASCIYSRSGEGMHRFVDPVDKEPTSTPSSRPPTPSARTPASTSPT